MPENPLCGIRRAIGCLPNIVSQRAWLASAVLKAEADVRLGRLEFDIEKRLDAIEHHAEANMPRSPQRRAWDLQHRIFAAAFNALANNMLLPRRDGGCLFCGDVPDDELAEHDGCACCGRGRRTDPEEGR